MMRKINATTGPPAGLRRQPRRPCLTVRQLLQLLLKLLQTLPPNARVRFLDTDDVYHAAAAVEDVMTVEAFQKSLDHSDAAKTIREAGLRRGEVVILGVTR